ncbi:hypothetical protein, partial [Photobacterium alginatilyticum]|uniref:hypothetical protein n=1 Tax=Photobacterium alginatilyticum TaxID=1775171 RepID=UPI00136B4499
EVVPDKEKEKAEKETEIPIRTGETSNNKLPEEDLIVLDPYPPPPFPERLKKPQSESINEKTLDVLRDVEITIPLIDAIEHIPSYAKSLKELCTKKRNLNVKSFYIKHINAMIQSDLPEKLKDPG